jgi:hypothetical protein
LLQRAKQRLEMVSIDEGIQIERSDWHPPNADSPKIETLEPDSNAKFESEPHPSKQDLEIVCMDEGIQIEESREHAAKANSPRLEILLPGSKVNVHKNPQP